jgi:hypothetical protein
MTRLSSCISIVRSVKKQPKAILARHIEPESLMKTKVSCLFIMLAVFSIAHAQGTAFSYQGRLNDNGNPANGSYDLSFSLYNAVTNGAAFGALTNTATGVTNGLFGVTLDFGGVFNGSNYWLEIAARTNGGGAFTILSPRQPLMPTPYAIYSANARNAATATSAVTAATASSANSISATNIVGAVANTQFATTATNAPNGVPLNNLVSALPFAVLYPDTNHTLCIWTNGSLSNPTTYTFPSSQSAGWNEAQAFFPYSTNGIASGFHLYLTAGEYDFYTRLYVTNNCVIEGAGGPSTVLVYKGETASFTMAGVVNQPSTCGLLSVIRPEQILPGSVYVTGGATIIMRNFSIKPSINMWCIGIYADAIDFLGDGLWVGGPQMFSDLDSHIGWAEPSEIPEPSKMIGFYSVGGGVEKLVNSYFIALADGVVFGGNTYNYIDNVQLDCCGQWGNNNTTSAFSSTSEFSLGAGVLVPLFSNEYFTTIKNPLTYKDNVPIYIGTGGVEISDWIDQLSFYANQVAMWTDGAGDYPFANIEEAPASSAPYVIAVTNNGSSFVFDGNHVYSPPATIHVSNQGGNYYDSRFYIGNLLVGLFNADTTTAAGQTGEFQLPNGIKLVGNLAGGTNLPASSITGGFTTNILIGGHTFYYTNGVLMNIQ